jgi:Uma2 family endonuclease
MGMVAQIEKRLYTAEEYLELEIAAETRSEYHDGEIIPMTGGLPNHNDIAGNLYVLLKLALRHQNYRVFLADQRLWIPEARLYTYPDVMVLSKPIELQTGRKDTVMNPGFIAEVLSKSTQNYDRGEKFVAYRSLVFGSIC